jgi:hypothetical protein
MPAQRAAWILLLGVTNFRKGSEAMILIRLAARAALAVLLDWEIVWAGCDWPARFSVYLDACGHNAYIWIAPSTITCFLALSFVPALRIFKTQAAR